jgi:hypothetical protein
MTKIFFWLVLCCTCITFLMMTLVLQNDTYLRYKSLTVGVYSKAKWIYERTIFDKTPIDVAFVGTSHTLNAIDSHLIEESFNLSSSSDLHFVNFAMPYFGRDMHRLVSQLLIEHKSPKVLIVEIRESEARALHPASHYLADEKDLFTAPLILNFRYLGNLIRLPLRETSLFFQTYFPTLFGITTKFEPKKYAGPHLNYALSFPDGRSRSHTYTPAELTNARINWEQSHSYVLAKNNDLIDYLYFNANWTNLRSLVNYAKTKGTKVYFAYIPNYGAPEKPINATIYESLAPILYINNKDIFKSTNHWGDLDHLNDKGALAYSRELTNILLKELVD